MSVVDTNVLVHSTAAQSPDHGRARTALLRLAQLGPVCIARQSLREYLAVTTRPQVWAQPLSLAQAFADVEAFARSFIILEDGPAVWEELVGLSRRVNFGGKQVHDANIVAAMLAHRETQLLTFNLTDFRRFEPLIELIEF